jgi:hypothetical protein
MQHAFKTSLKAAASANPCNQFLTILFQFEMHDKADGSVDTRTHIQVPYTHTMA